MNEVAARILSRTAEGRSGELLPRPFRVESVRRELDDCVTLWLSPLKGEPMAFEPGQFTMLYMPGIGEIPISISGDPARPELLVQTIRAVGAVSKACCALGPGDRIGVRGPYGKPWPVEAALGRHLLVVAGGIGLAPTRPIIHWALRHRAEIKGLHLLYGARTPDGVLYPSQLLGWSGTAGMTVSVTVDRHAEDWSGRVGVVTELVSSLPFDPAQGTAMICGPEVMMRFTLQTLEGWGMAAEQMHVSMERSMKCGVGWCGQCQLGPHLVCRDGPVFAAPEIKPLIGVWEL